MDKDYDDHLLDWYGTTDPDEVIAIEKAMAEAEAENCLHEAAKILESGRYISKEEAAKLLRLASDLDVVIPGIVLRHIADHLEGKIGRKGQPASIWLSADQMFLSSDEELLITSYIKLRAEGITDFLAREILADPKKKKPDYGIDLKEEVAKKIPDKKEQERVQTNIYRIIEEYSAGVSLFMSPPSIRKKIDDFCRATNKTINEYIKEYPSSQSLSYSYLNVNTP